MARLSVWEDLNGQGKEAAYAQQKDANRETAPYTPHGAEGVGNLVLIGMITGTILLGAFYYYIVNYLDPQMDIDLSSYKLAYTSVVYYTDAQGVDHELERLYDTENREWVSLSQIPKHMQDATVAIEDERFWKHNGVDWKRTFAAVFNLLTGGSERFGASTSHSKSSRTSPVTTSIR